jgi:hypothetical protein
MAGTLLELRVLTMAELLRRGPEELGVLCGLKLGPKMKFVKVVERLRAASMPEASAVQAPPAAAVAEQSPAVVSPELQMVSQLFLLRHLRFIGFHPHPSFRCWRKTV